MTRLAFFGSPAVAAGTLEALVDAGHEIVAVVSGPDRRRGRGGVLTPTPVKQVALDRFLPVAEGIDDALGRGAELGIVVAFGSIIPAAALEQLPMLNVHFSLLPRWRGAAPVERAILAGDLETGISIMALEAGLDTGPVYVRAAVEIGSDETAAELTERLGELGNRLLVELLAEGLPTPSPQLGEANYARKIAPEELELDFTRPAFELARVVRIGRAWTTFRGERLLVHRARVAEMPGDTEGAAGTLFGSLVQTGESALELIEVQAAGRAPQPVSVWALGARPAPGERLGQADNLPA